MHVCQYIHLYIYSIITLTVAGNIQSLFRREKLGLFKELKKTV